MNLWEKSFSHIYYGMYQIQQNVRIWILKSIANRLHPYNFVLWRYLEIGRKREKVHTGACYYDILSVCLAPLLTCNAESVDYKFCSNVILPTFPLRYVSYQLCTVKGHTINYVLCLECLYLFIMLDTVKHFFVAWVLKRGKLLLGAG